MEQQNKKGALPSNTENSKLTLHLNQLIDIKKGFNKNLVSWDSVRTVCSKFDT
jgi:hypothetical protein